MQTILIITDFSSSTFSSLPALCKQYSQQSLKLVFTHLFSLSDSITDMLMLARRNREFEHVNDEFYANCIQLKAENKHISTIKIEFFYGSTLSMFKDFLTAQQIDAILAPPHCSLNKLNQHSTPPENFIERAGLPILVMEPFESDQKVAHSKSSPVLEIV